MQLKRARGPAYFSEHTPRGAPVQVGSHWNASKQHAPSPREQHAARRGSAEEKAVQRADRDEVAPNKGGGKKAYGDTRARTRIARRDEVSRHEDRG